MDETPAIPRTQQHDKVFYTCGKCSRTLFYRSQVLHEGTSGSSAGGVGVSEVKASWGQIQNTYKGIGGKCSSVFTAEAPDWTQDVAGNDGRISCPNCKARVGSFSWSGAPCSCGRWITPAFQFQLSRIDPKGIVTLPISPSANHGDGVMRSTDSSL